MNVWIESLIGGGIGGALIGGAVSFVNTSRQLKRVDERLAKIDEPRLQIEHARLEMDRTAEPRAREREAYVELLDAFNDMNDWLNTIIESNAETEHEIERRKHELLGKYNRAATKVSTEGDSNVQYFAVDAAQSFQAYVNSVLMQEPVEDLWDRFLRGQRAVQDIIKLRIASGITHPPS